MLLSDATTKVTAPSDRVPYLGARGPRFAEHSDQTHGTRERTVNEQQWSVDVHLAEHTADGSEMSVSARARLVGLDGVTLEGAGRARLFARHSTAVTISREVAVARALADLSHRLLRSAADEEAVASRANRGGQEIGSPAQPDIG
jgi:hypothetical protein